MEWSDQAVILHAERYGEGDAILEVMTLAHGRHRGYVKGGMSRRRRADLQPGNEVALTWRARLDHQLGHFTIEVTRARVADLIARPRALAAFSAVAAVLIAALPEREAHSATYNGLIAFLDLLGAPASEDAGDMLNDYGEALVRFEIGLLGDLGFALDLSACAASGVNEDLIYVSPKSGRAVSREAGQPYHDKLLALPPFLAGSGPADAAGIAAGLALSGHFLQHHVLVQSGKAIPAARQRFEALFRA